MHTQVSAAMDAHNNWKARLVDAIESGKIDGTVDGIRVDDNCLFGHWLYGAELTEEMKSSENYLEVKRVHAEFHHQAARIAELALQGDKEVAFGLLHGPEYTNAAMKLTNALYYLDKLL